MTVDDVKALAPAALAHRMLLTPEAELRGVQPLDLVDELLDRIETPAPARSAARRGAVRPGGSHPAARTRDGIGAATVVLGVVVLPRRVAARLDRADGVAAGCLVALAVAVPFIIGRSTGARLERRRAGSGDGRRAVRGRAGRRQPGHGADAGVGIDEVVGGTRRSRRRAGAARPAASTDGVPTADRPSRQGARRARRGRPRRSGRAAAPGGRPRPRRRRSGCIRGGRSVRPLPAGFAKDLEGPTTDASPAGDVAFHAMRPYRLGDDPRHIHWMSTARTGSHGAPLRRQPPAHARRAARRLDRAVRRRRVRDRRRGRHVAGRVVTGAPAPGDRPHRDGVVGRTAPTRRPRLVARALDPGRAQ